MVKSGLLKYGPVISIDISSVNNQMIAGFEDGSIILINLIKKKIAKEIKVHNSKVLILKMVQFVDNEIKIVSSDDQGCSKITFVKKGILTHLWKIFPLVNEKK